MSAIVQLSALALIEVPPLGGRVNDLAGLLAADQRQQLESELSAFENETSHQLVVLTVRSLDGEAIEPFSMRVAEAWQIGHQGLDNGVIIVVAAQDRRARIEVGYGLEGVVPDAVASRVMREQMIPSFRESDMGAGILNGARAVMAAARGEEIAAVDRPGPRDRKQLDPFSAVLFCGIFGGIFGASIGRSHKIVGALVGGAIAFGISYLILNWIGASIFASTLGGFFGSMGGGLPIGRRGLGGIHTFPRGGWGSGGFGGGGGGFGGGGGGFGGGGASGSW